MKSVEAHGLTENTLVIFSSDNGPTYDDGYKDGTTILSSGGEVDRGHDASGVWSGGKGQIWEGATRVPFIVRWPSRVNPGTSDALVSQVDLLASFAALLGIKLGDSDAVDSRNILSAFLGDRSEGLDYMIEESLHLALRSGDWKFVEATRVKTEVAKRRPLPESLFNLDEDPGEHNNLIGQYPEKAEALRTLLKKLKEGNGLRQSLN
jgi:arylsulfatase A-like enzyme